VQATRSPTNATNATTCPLRERHRQSEEPKAQEKLPSYAANVPVHLREHPTTFTRPRTLSCLPAEERKRSKHIRNMQETRENGNVQTTTWQSTVADSQYESVQRLAIVQNALPGDAEEVALDKEEVRSVCLQESRATRRTKSGDACLYLRAPDHVCMHAARVGLKLTAVHTLLFWTASGS